MSQPEWSKQVQKAREFIQLSEEIRDNALSLRCGDGDSGGARCTADAYPEHVHRHRQEDLP